MNRLKVVTDKRQNQLSESIVWPLRHSLKGQFSLTGRGGLKRNKTMQKGISASKSTFHSFHRKIGFQNTFYTKCINVIIERIGQLFWSID